MTSWIGIGATNLDSACGGDLSLAQALDGLDRWTHATTEIHWFILDLKQAYVVTKVRGRSYSSQDPIDVNLYISEDKGSWTKIAEAITTWQDRDTWLEIDVTDAQGRYIKVEIEATEDAIGRNIRWGRSFGSFTIIDVGYSVAPPSEGAEGTGWEMLSIEGTSTYDKSNLEVIYNGTTYTWTEATTDDNEESEPLILQWVYGWDYSTQNYTSATNIDPAKGYWFYWYHQGELYVTTGGGEEGVGVHVMPGKMVSIGPS